MPLTEEQINALLTKKAPQVGPKTKLHPPSQQKPTLGYPPPEQHGPLRWKQTATKCVSRGCGSSTYCKVQGIPYCTMHALKVLNEMLVGMGVSK